MDWKKKIEELMIAYIRRYERESGTTMRWETPLIGVADADSPEFMKLRQLVHPEHAMPRDILPDASAVVSYFLPYPKEISRSNRTDRAANQLCISLIETPDTPYRSISTFSDVTPSGGTLAAGCLHIPAASGRWAEAYRETNKLFVRLNDYLAETLADLNQGRRTAACFSVPRSRQPIKPLYPVSLPL